MNGIILCVHMLEIILQLINRFILACCRKKPIVQNVSVFAF